MGAWGHREKLGGDSGARTAFMGSPLPASPQRQAYKDERPQAWGKANALDRQRHAASFRKGYCPWLASSWALASPSLLCSCGGGGAVRNGSGQRSRMQG